MENMFGKVNDRIDIFEYLLLFHFPLAVIWMFPPSDFGRGPSARRRRCFGGQVFVGANRLGCGGPLAAAWQTDGYGEAVVVVEPGAEEWDSSEEERSSHCCHYTNPVSEWAYAWCWFVQMRAIWSLSRLDQWKNVICAVFLVSISQI